VAGGRAKQGMTNGGDSKPVEARADGGKVEDRWS